MSAFKQIPINTFVQAIQLLSNYKSAFALNTKKRTINVLLILQKQYGMNLMMKSEFRIEDIANFTFFEEPLTTRDFTSVLYKDFKTVRLRSSKTFVYELQKRIDHLKQHMPFCNYTACDLFFTQLKLSTQKIFDAILNCEKLLQDHMEKLKISQKKLWSHLQKIKNDILIITMYLEV